MGADKHSAVDDSGLTFRQIIDSSPVLIHTGRPDGYLDFFNCTWLEFIGQPLEKLLGWRWAAFIHPEDVDAFVERMKKSFAKGEPFEETSRVRRADGVYRWMLHRKVPQRDADGNVIKWFGSSVDIQERTRAEEELKASAQLLQRNEFYLAEAQRLGQMGNWVFDPPRGFDYWSRELFRMHGLDPETQTAPTVEEYLARVHPQDRQFMASLIEQTAAEGLGFDITKRIVRPDGAVRHIRCVAAPVVESGTLKRLMGSAMDVTEHEVLTQELRRREAYLAEAQRLSHTGSFGWKPASEMHVWSNETYRIFEYDSTTIITPGLIMKRIHPADRKLVGEVIEQASTSGGAIDCEYRLLFPEDRVKYVRVLARPLATASDELEFAGAVIDITETKRAEEKLRLSEKELRTMIEVMPAHIAVTQPDGTVDFVNQSWLNYTGFTREQAMGWGWTKTIHPEDLEQDVANWQIALAAGEPLEQEVRAKNADGVYRWFLNRNIPLRDEEGHVLKWYGILFDINTLKDTEQALQMQKHQLLGIIETIPSMLWSTSPTGEPTHNSQRLLEYVGASQQEFVDGGWLSFIHPHDREESAKAFSRAVETGESYNAIHRVRRADGEYLWHQTRGEPLRDPDGKIIQWYGLSVDIDERKRAEDHLRYTRMKLTTAAKIATVAELSASIAHELNQPLMAVLGNAQAANRWLAANPPDLAEAKASIERILRDIHSADTAMQHIRALFKHEPYEKSDESVLDILRESLRFVHEGPHKRDVAIDWFVEGSLPPIRVDRIQAQQVFINLISNAIEATHGNTDTPRIGLRVFAVQEHEVVVQIIDNGTGLEDTEKIFDAFITTKEKGLGIGLAVSKTIVEAHGGRLWAKNNPGGGATFSVAFPVASGRESKRVEVKEPRV
jgi:PAS domain S-box-containing protein